MADDVAVTDILCEAMEYLSKLGANLRSRSESLKEKRIRRDRLKNAHAVHKAAQKVLTICELSKKSLDNVETGVKRILSAVSATQASTGDGGKTTKREHGHTSSRSSHSSSHKPTSEKSYKHLSSPKSVYVSGKKYVLKFPRKVNVKHFQSVKVMAKVLPKSFLEKYPVYYNCKLYRTREKKSTPTRSSLDEPDKVKESESNETLDEVSMKNKTADSDVDSEAVAQAKDEPARDKYDDNVSKTESRKSNKNRHERKPSTIELSDSDSPEPETSEKNRKHSRENEYSNKKKSNKLEKVKAKKHKRIIVDSSDSEQDTKNSLEEGKDEKCNKEILSEKLLAEKNMDISDEKQDDTSMEKSDEKENNIDGTKKYQDQETEPVKPLIKCVSLTKLLKPDVLVKEVKTVDMPCVMSNKNKPNKVVFMNTKGELRSKLLDAPKRVTFREQESEKLKEVANFKPKPFYIKVVKLPMFSTEFLKENNLKRIMKNGSIVSEISPGSPNITHNEDVECTDTAKKQSLNDSDSEILLNKTKSDNLMSKNNGAQVTDSANDKSADEARSALLNYSGGENTEKVPVKCDKNTNAKKSNDINESEKIKKSLLYDSESDKNEDNPSDIRRGDDNILQKMPTEVTSSKDAEEPKQISEDDTSKTTVKENTVNNEEDKELAKSSLLHDSSGSSTKSPDKKRKNDEGGMKSRRKHIMESMHAKKMLLTYSSSSDTEDEELKNTIKNIKENLLKNIESEDETNKSVKRKLLSSSESDEDVVKRPKKKRKMSQSKSPSPEKGDGENGNGSAKNDEDNTSKKSQSDSGGEKSCNEDNNNASTSRNSQSDSGNEKSNSSRRKMGRSREKPGGSSSQNSDNQDDKDIEGLTNLKSLSKTRRRRGSDSEKAESTRTTSTRASSANAKNKMSNLKHIKGEEGLVEASESSDEASAVESEGQEEEDLPPISLPGLNGSGIEHLAKDDLLEDSESDSSKDRSSDVKNENDSDSDAPTGRRRKANTISSDSEVGSSSKKDKNVKMSDFEDSEDENSEPVKKNKRKKKASDSDASAGSSDDSGGGKKKRKRIKQIDSDGSGSDSENEGKNKHGRKNIRKVMGKNQLEEATKKAAREEKERVARIAERQKLYNNLEFDESGKPDEVIVDKVVLDFDPNTKEPLIEVDRGLVKKLKPHQANGIKFMWDACFESVKRIKKDRGSGCILAHCMGLGKTLQVVSLTHTLLTHSDLTTVERVLVVCPLSTVLNWVNEFNMWLKHALTDYDVDVYELSKFKQNSERAFQLSSWFKHGGVCVLGYEMFRNLSADNPKKFKKKMLKQFQEALVDPGPDLVVCDEGHLLKNEKTSLSQSMNRVKTRRRIVLTGTPLQNNLKEYYCMVQFVKPNLLGKYNEYLNRFVNPITNGQYTDSTEHDIKIMKRRSHVLHNMLEGAVQRRDYGVLAPFLPPKHEYVLFITLTEVQIKLYQHYLDNYSRRPLPGKSSGFLFPDFQSMQRIWTHPLVLKYNSERYEIMQQKKRDREEEEDSEGSLADFIDDDSTPDETSSEDMSDSLSDASDDSRKKKKKKSSKKSKKEDKKGPRRGTRSNPNMEIEEVMPDPEVLLVKNDNPTEWWIPLVSDDEIEDMRNSNKLVLLFEILRQCEAIGDKLLVFSQSLYSLDLIEHFLGKVDEATQEGRIDEKLGGHVGSWSPGIDYFRLDGSTSCENRSIWCKNFNREDNPRARLFLISTRAGGLGINLVAANRVVIFDVSWNPSHDVQSIFRVYRFGQKKPCYIYRFLAMGTMEEKIYERQVTKQAISKRVIDEQQIDRHYAENDLAELYKFEPRPPEPRPVPLIPKDRLFAEMVKEREHVIYKFHEHDSLLENKEEETLSEEERKAAWEDFENEKNRPPPQPFPSWPMNNGMAHMPNLLAAQQQQQLAYAALAQMLRKDMPNLSDDNIRAMLPLIYSSNPGLMQKLSSMYTQPGMMNASMMNPGGMNLGGAQQSGMGGGGGTSGLQYEPPWQRQQQQQQQMRLQQLMQQQSQMGAKLYAGGLGSRDPIAMALQQQRAREIMLGGGAGGGGGGGGATAGRPRGRPPLQPRAPALPATAPGDVVNLDSD
ncbi:hypothetical protein O0L34_g13729 [Tuta absoluta]|nr:hypothetical protein O0L34_g13729 [Tuta absoluta]